MKAAEATPDFGMEMADFDINAAFQQALHGVVTDTELALEEKIQRMETIIGQGASDMYREFVDFRQMAAQMQTFCAHDHSLHEATQNSETLSDFMGKHDGSDHAHDDHSHEEQSKDDDDDEADPKSRKKKRRWLKI